VVPDAAKAGEKIAPKRAAAKTAPKRAMDRVVGRIDMMNSFG
jgi:hypothetical protein